MSAIKIAHTLSAIALNLFQSISLEYAENQAKIIFGFSFKAILSTSSISITPVFLSKK
jgi:hypothetical protein